MKQKTKICETCRKTLPLKRFWTDRSRIDKLQYVCIDCCYIRDNDENAKKLRKTWNQNHKEIVNNAVKRYHKKYPERQKARIILSKAVKAGTILREVCKVCKSDKVHAHHPDWSKPLEVIWLCPAHHKDIHFGRIQL